jgi:hypothetical protein
MTHTNAWTVEIYLYEDEDHTSAKATLVSGAGANRQHTLVGAGKASRNPADASVPEIGEEVAVARALRSLADRLLETASSDIADITKTEVHLTH